MKQQYNVLVLTDHSKHTEQNSVYSIVQSFLQNDQCNSIQVASRGSEVNSDFFQNQNSEALFGITADHTFRYTDEGKSYTTNQNKLDIRKFNLVMMRLPRPISNAFLLWIKKTFEHATIINDPTGIIETSNKKFLLELKQYCPPIRLCRSIEEVISFSKKHSIVMKPLEDYGGNGVFKIIGDRVDDGRGDYDLVEYLKTIETQLQKEGYLAMKYLKNVSQGDKRILVVGAQIMGASLRLPKEGNWLCNVSQGGSSVDAQITPEELEMINKIAPILMKKGIVIFGADTLVNDAGQRVLSEINTLSIGGFKQSEEQTGRPILANTISQIMTYADSK